MVDLDVSQTASLSLGKHEKGWNMKACIWVVLAAYIGAFCPQPLCAQVHQGQKVKWSTLSSRPKPVRGAAMSAPVAAAAAPSPAVAAAGSPATGSSAAPGVAGRGKRQLITASDGRHEIDPIDKFL